MWQVLVSKNAVEESSLVVICQRGFSAPGVNVPRNLQRVVPAMGPACTAAISTQPGF